MNALDPSSRDYWRGVLVAGGFTAIPRWTVNPAVGVAEHEEMISDDLVARLRRLADEMSLSLGSVLLAAHAKVLAALSGEIGVLTGYVAVAGGPPLPCPLTTKPDSWRSLLVDAHRVEKGLLSHKEFPVDDLRRELRQTEPAFEAVFDPTDSGGALAKGAVLSVGVSRRENQLALRLRYRTEAIDKDCAARIAGYHLTALTLIAADPDAEHGRQSLLSAEELIFQIEGLAGPRLELPDCRFHELFEQRARAHPDVVAGVHGKRAVDLRGTQRPRQPVGTSPDVRGLRREGVVAVVLEAQPGLDGRCPRRVQGRWRVPAHRAAFPCRSHCDHALASRVQACADRVRQHCHAQSSARQAVRGADAACRCGLPGRPHRG